LDGSIPATTTTWRRFLVLAALDLAALGVKPNAGAAHGATGRPSRAHRTQHPAVVTPPPHRLSSRVDEGELEPMSPLAIRHSAR
jgi:hypothetical protein